MGVIEHAAQRLDRELEARQIIREMLTVMEIQEKRESGEFHLSANAMRPLWDRAKDRARQFIGDGGEQNV